MKARAALTIAAGATIALAAWTARIPAQPPPPPKPAAAPVNRDYLRRDATIAFEEREVRRNPRDQITARMLASQYLQRFRERGDPGDVLRAQAMAQQSLRLQPQGNTSAHAVLASALLSFHDFRGALAHEDAAIAAEPFDETALAQRASLFMELGEYDRAAQAIALRPRAAPNPTWDSVQARYEELHGNLAGARALIARAASTIDSFAFASAYDRSWYHVRAGQLAFEAGDDASAEREYAAALHSYPDNASALLSQARLYRGQRRWGLALAAATRSADIYPLPQALGYKADAQRELGDAEAAKQTDALIYAEERLFNVQGANDRLLANYFVQRRVHLADALAAARADLRRRGDEVYADDTMAWTLAALGRWTQARAYSEKALRLGSADPQLQFHAAIIGLHTGRRAEALQYLRSILQRNSHFDPYDAARARHELTGMASDSFHG